MADSGAKRASVEFFQYLINSTESCVDDKVCVVGIFGKDNIGFKSKAVHLNGTIGKEVFKIDFLDSMFKKKDVHDFSCDIDVYHDVEQRIIYLHLVSVYDVSRMLQLCKQAPHDVQNAESHQYWMSHEFYYACALMFLFSVSHIIVVLHPSQSFDLSYIRLFHTLASTRHQLLPQISQLLSGVDGIPDIWRQTGRPCIPRLVCSLKQRVPFMNPSQMSGKNQDTYASKTKGKQQTTTPQKKLQHAIEDQLYSIMKKARLLGSLSSSSLFTVNSSHAFVHVQPCSTAFDPVAVLLNTLAKPAINTHWVESSPLLKNSKFLKREQDLSPGSSESLPSGNGQVLFKDYLKQQIDHLMTGDAGRDGVAEGRRGTHVEVPSCRLWARVSLVLFEFFMTPKSDLIAPLTTMASHLDLDMKFSEARCRKAIPVATSAYLEGLPSHYTQNVHLNQLSQALRVFSLHARGPAFEHYAAQFQDESNKVWMNGRQLCEERSLTGRHCVYPYHRVPADGEPPSDPGSEESKDLGIIPCKPHSSRITSLCACNCGRMQDHREDPFDLKAANVDFYQILEKKCCTSLVHLLFPLHPIFSFATSSNQAANEPAGDSPVLETTSDTGDPPGEEVVSGDGISDDQQANQGSDGEQVASPIVTTTAAVPIPNASKSGRAATVESQGHRASSTYGSSGYQSTLDMMSHEGPEFRSITSEFKSVVSLGIPGELSTVGSEDVFSATDNAQGKGSDDMLSRQLTEKEQVFLETMLTTESPAGLYPRFPSWSLCRVGGSGGYNPAKGLEQPGFFPNSNFLLAWDIPLLNDSQSDLTSQFDVQGTHFGSKQMTEEAWPTLNELPSASGTTLSSLPLYQALTYARRQSADYKGNAPPLVSSSNSGKGSASSSRQRGRATRERVVPTVRAYIGEEYECPRGHRFICSGPDKMVKATSSGHVKETAHKLVTSDMPLYFPCPCRSSKPLMAQMMRVFVVTPDSPVLVTLNPRVQPSIPPCPVFYPGIAAGLSLPPASFCVLRLPYVYVGDDGPVLPPADSQPLLSCRVLKGMFSAMGHIQDNAKGNAMEAKR